MSAWAGTAEERPTSSGGGLDWGLVAASLVLVGFGLLSLYSRGIGRSDGILEKQLIRMAVGIVPFLIFYLVDPSWLRRTSWGLYVVNLGLLLMVLVAGDRGGGAQRWLNIGPLEFQPSEMSKLLLVITIAAFFANRSQHTDRLSTFILSIVHLVPPVMLVFAQPHLGATLVLVTAWVAICILAKVPWRFLFGILAIFVVLAAAVWSIPGILKDYQRGRIEAMRVDDVHGKDYQQTRAAIALGSGGVTGAGFLRGEQKAGRFIPAQHTDFVFTIVGEEGGLVGASLVLAAFAFFFYRLWRLMVTEPDPFRHFVLGGIFAVLAFHTVANLGMNVGLTPVVGLWLPFMSYGGTAMWLVMACVALALNIGRRQGAFQFSSTDRG